MNKKTWSDAPEEDLKAPNCGVPEKFQWNVHYWLTWLKFFRVRIILGVSGIYFLFLPVCILVCMHWICCIFFCVLWLWILCISVTAKTMSEKIHTQIKNKQKSNRETLLDKIKWDTFTFVGKGTHWIGK